MSVIIAKPTARRSAVPLGSSCNYFPALSSQNTIASGNQTTVDLLPIADYLGAKWLVIAASADGTRIQAFEIFAIQGSSVSPTYTQYAILGDQTLDVSITVTVSGGNMNLNIINDDVFSITTYVTRLGLPSTNVLTFPLSQVEVTNISAVVLALQTQVIDFLSYADNVYGSQWLITITSSTGVKISSKLFAILRSGSIIGTEYNLIGDSSFTYDLILSEVVGVGVELSLANFSALDYVVDIARIPMMPPSSSPAVLNTTEALITIPPPTTIPPGDTRTVDLLSHAYISSAAWLVAVVGAGPVVMGCQIQTVDPSSSTTTLTVYSILGDSMDVTFTTSIIANRTALFVTNNELIPITVNILRVPTAA